MSVRPSLHYHEDLFLWSWVLTLILSIESGLSQKLVPMSWGMGELLTAEPNTHIRSFLTALRTLSISDEVPDIIYFGTSKKRLSTLKFIGQYGNGLKRWELFPLKIEITCWYLILKTILRKSYKQAQPAEVLFYWASKLDLEPLYP